MSRLSTIHWDASATTTEYVRDWRHDAACLDEDPEMFHPGNRDREGIADAKAVCGRCPVARECGEYALNEGITGGIWGGMDEAERAEIRRRIGAPPVVTYEPCGTDAALKRHQRAGERCETCRRAGALRQAEQRASA